MEPESTRPRPTERATAQAAYYRYWAEDQVRFGDIDFLGHVTNTAYLHYAESVRAPFMREAGLWNTGQVTQGVVVRHEVDYLRELGYPARLRLGLSVTHLGARSYGIVQGVFFEDQCHAVIHTRMVRMDRNTHRAVPLQEHERVALGAWMAPAEF